MWEANPEVLTTDLGDELVLMDPQRSVMFSLNDSGRLIWQALPASQEQLKTLLKEAYGLPDTQAEQDLGAVLNDLSSRHLVRRQ
ncbi:PqqD family protein [Deinococcus sp. QL22]|uniref:PqqD family protein n=1 Tax=Deinococcus sp. QL22 TaxID=2939437 RepID=UPI002017D4C3|nr:PqqD family protein [Deinococcus sp. QL22]UQN09588.1 PqqD family protein [Deinococcus sp. QL22]